MRGSVALFLSVSAGLWAQTSFDARLPEPAQSWRRVAALSPGDVISVVPKDGPVVEGRYQSISPESLMVESKLQIRSLPLDSIKQVSVRRKASRAKTAGIAAAVGFGVAFPIGAASAGYLSDQNNPSFSTRAGTGVGMGLFGAAIAGGVGALAGGSRFETVYRYR